MNENIVRTGNFENLLSKEIHKYLPEIAKKFDAATYLAENADVRREQINPLEHYLRHGWKERRRPNAYFIIDKVSSGQYSKIPFVDEIVAGCIAAGNKGSNLTGELDPHVYQIISDNLDRGFYCRQLSDGQQPSDPILHYIDIGVMLGLDPAPDFDTLYYLEKNQDISEAGINPYYHFLIQGKKENRVHRASKTLIGSKGVPVSDSVAQSADNDGGYQRILTSGLFDPAWFRATYTDIAGDDSELARHYILYGEGEGRQPNCVFDAKKYSSINNVPLSVGNLLLHYINEGEMRGFRPNGYFMPEWYAENYKIPTDISPLAHYIKSRGENKFSPCPYFNPEYYLKTNEDVASSGVNAFEHWYSWGMQEGRVGSTDFDVEFIWREYLGGDKSKNPLDWYIAVGVDLGWKATPDVHSPTVHSEVRRFTSAGPEFEEFSPASIPVTGRRIKALAYYLTQFHAIPENDEWWGKGFTEWTNIPRGLPRFQGHYQPRVPRDLGYYQLSGDDTEVMRRQVDLAKRAGLYGFCFYYYNFSGHRLLEKPLDAFVADSEIDFPFCLMWANENWTRRWDGYDNDILMKQDYSPEYLPPLVDDLAKYLKHPNYIKSQGRPLFSFYRADVIPETASVLAKIRQLFIQRHDIDPLFIIAQAFGTNDPRPHGFDAALEFPPHKIGVIQSSAQTSVKMYDATFKGKIIRYDEAVEYALSDRPTEYPLIKTAFPSWDNDARKQGSGMCFIGSSPAKFENWLDGIISYSKSNPVFGDNYIVVNAWNEWCEGAYLEPDCHYGYAYLNALSRSLSRAAGAGLAKKVLLFGHDAFKAGAQQLLLAIGTHLVKNLNLSIEFVLMGGGEMVQEYKRIAPVYVVEESPQKWQQLSEFLAEKARAGFSVALTNSIVSGSAVGSLSSHGFRVVSLVHELPAIVREYNIQGHWEAIRTISDVVVFPNDYVRQELTVNFDTPARSEVTRAQGIYKKIKSQSFEGASLRQQLGIPEGSKLVLNMGYADYRKGLDIFIQAAQCVSNQRDEVHFLWVGKIQDQLGNWIRRDVERLKLNNVHFLPFDANVAPYLYESDLFLLTSREDPFPSVVLEAISAGLPVVCFDWGGGFKDLIASNGIYGRVSAYLNISDMAENVLHALDDAVLNSAEAKSERARCINEVYDFDKYCKDLYAMLFPNWNRVSAVIPNYNYERYLEERVESIVKQDYLVNEVIVLDDASSDNSVSTINNILNKNSHRLQLIVNEKNSGSVFKQWRKALEVSSGDYIWIAEADDAAQPTMLSSLVRQLDLNPKAHFVFCDSVSINSDGELCYESYKGYYSSLGDDGLLNDNVFDSIDFMKRFLSVRNFILNASSVVWRRESLLAAFERLGERLYDMRCAGDWMVYLAACMSGGEVAYVSSALNVHRRHSESVTHAQKRVDQLNEIMSCHDYFNKFYKNVNLEIQQRKYVDELKAQFEISI